LIKACSAERSLLRALGTWRTFRRPSIPIAFRLNIGGHVERTLSLTLDDLVRTSRRLKLRRQSMSGNSRLLQSRVAEVSGPMARWEMPAGTGVRLKDVLDRAGVRPGRCKYDSTGSIPASFRRQPDFHEIALIDHARDGES